MTGAEAPPCTVVVVPTHGFGNRMRMLSCAHAYAAHHGCVLQALWRTTLHMPTPWADLFATPLAQPDPSTVVRHGDRLYTVARLAASFARLSADDPDACEPGPPAGHTDQWIDSVDPRAEPKAVLFIGGRGASNPDPRPNLNPHPHPHPNQEATCSGRHPPWMLRSCAGGVRSSTDRSCRCPQWRLAYQIRAGTRAYTIAPSEAASILPTARSSPPLATLPRASPLSSRQCRQACHSSWRAPQQK